LKRGLFTHPFVALCSALRPFPDTPSSTPLCAKLDYLPGAWLSEADTFQHTDPLGAPCRLLKAEPIPQADLKWLRFLGDSNMREFMPILAEATGAGECMAYKSESDAHPTTLVCWNEDTIFTFNWWFQNQFVSPNATTDAQRLATLLDYTLGDFLDSVPWDRSKPWPQQFDEYTSRPERIYISVGSHAPAATTKGVHTLLESLHPLFEANKPAIVLALTSPTEPSMLPKLYQPTKVMRNNVMLKATNQVIVDFGIRTGIRVLDLFTLTRTMGRSFAKDAVHFKTRVYELWADIYFTEWNMDARELGERERRSLGARQRRRS
jgi:hypothetical protein